MSYKHTGALSCLLILFGFGQVSAQTPTQRPTQPAQEPIPRMQLGAQMAQMAGSISVLDTACGASSGQTLQASKIAQKEALFKEGMAPETFEAYYTQGVQETATRWAKMSPQQRINACSAVRSKAQALAK